MTATNVDQSQVEAHPTIRDRAIDAARHTAHISHEAQLLESLAADALEDGAHAVKRAMRSARRRVEQLEDVRDEAAHWVKRQPLKALAIGVGAGLVLGIAVGLIGRFGMRKPARAES